MNFGDILDKWEKQSGGTIIDKASSGDSSPAGRRNFAGERRSRLLRKKPDDFIDLHGLNRDEAWTALESFFENSRRTGLEKVLIIHGKGNHWSGGSGAPCLCEGMQKESSLMEISRRFIERCSFAGESGYSNAREGGTGATWVILKEGAGNQSYRSR